MDLKKALLNLGEEGVKSVIHDFLRPEAEKYIKDSANKVDDIILPFLDQIEAALLAAADKIDGEVG